MDWWNLLFTSSPHWFEAAGVLYGMFKLIVLMGRHLERFDTVVDTVKDHDGRLDNHEHRLIKVEYSRAAAAKHIEVRH